MHPDKALVATGQTGKAPFVCVWDSSSLETVSILQGGHDRGISALAFSVDGSVSDEAEWNVCSSLMLCPQLVQQD